ncbi:GDSL-type esterase/lipase family protein [Labilibaculum manganireducens]|uniref:GDSL-type esterase/lipase family protein n=1 Tax=Labilibaculum manganireducens TaxID=1940525 RepID=UPI0029F5BAA2|nr:GDSL-type esterase/lipase family protein [Labilibaculum manganireducens]
MKKYKHFYFPKIQHIRRLFFAVVVFFGAVSFSENTTAQNTIAYDTTYTFAHYKIRRAFYEGLPNRKHEIVFLGNSITENGDWNEIFRNKNIVNRGIGGDVCWGVLNRLDEVLSSQPKYIFLMIGINDIGRSVPVDIIAGKIQEIIWRIKAESPSTKVYLQSVLPINEEIIWYDYMKNKSDKIIELNEQLVSIAAKSKIQFLDLYSHFVDEKGNLKQELTADGIHLSAFGYLLWRDIFKEKGIRF